MAGERSGAQGYRRRQSEIESQRKEKISLCIVLFVTMSYKAVANYFRTLGRSSNVLSGPFCWSSSDPAFGILPANGLNVAHDARRK